MSTFEILDLVQGSDEWHQTRLEHCTASEAPIMMGDSDHGKRNELLALKKTGVAKEVSRFVKEKVFDPGHEMEAAQRLLIEEKLGEDLFPTTARVITDGIPLLASTDGQTMDGSILFEHKGWSEELAEMVRSNNLSAKYYWQLEQLLHVFGAEKVIFVTSDGTADKREMMDYYPVPGRFAQLLGGWAQFLDDLATFEVASPVEKITARSIENLPQLTIRLSGGVAQSNLNEYRAGALAFIENINTDLKTDQDFADAEATVKFCDSAEKRIKEIKDAALSETADIKAIFDTLDELGAAMREKRLALNKLVTTQKKAVKDNIQLLAEKSWHAHVEAINKEIGPRVRLPEIACDVAAAMANKRNIASLQDAADTCVAKAKLQANEIATTIRANLMVLRELDQKYRPLFQDAQTITQKDPEDFQNLVNLRVKEADEAEQEAERLRIENENRIREEAAEKERQRIADEAKQKELAEQKRLDDEAEAQRQANEQASSTVDPVGDTAASSNDYAAARDGEPASDPEPAAEEPAQQPTDFPRATLNTRTVTRGQPVYEQGAAPMAGKLVSLENLLLAIIDGAASPDLVQINQAAVDAYIAEKGCVPPGFVAVGKQ